MVDKKNLHLRMGLVLNRSKVIVVYMVISLLKNLSVQTITFDNGKDFVDHKRIAFDLDTDINFTHPYSSYKNGRVNTNGLIHQYVSKDTDF